MKRLLKYLFTLGVAALTFAACEEEQPELVNFTLSADAAFNASLEATVKVTGDKAAPSDITVALFLDNASTFPAGSLEFAASVKVAAGSKEATAKVKISGIDALEGGKEYKAVFGAKVNDVPLQQKVTISFTKPEDPVTFRFSADPEFVNNICMLKVDATKEVKEETLVTITLDAKSTMPAEALTIPELKIAKGAKHGEIQVTLNPDVLTPGQEYTAIFNAAIGGDAIGSGTTSFSKQDLNGKWSVIGTINGSNWDKDFEMTGYEGWYTVEGIEAKAGNEFKFRRDGAWDLAFGIAEKGTPALDTEFEVTNAPGAPNIVIGEDGVYGLSLNPNKAVAKIVKTGDLVKVLTLADLVALMPSTNKEKADFKGIINDLVVTYVSGSNIFLEDATSAILLYKSGTGLQAGVTLSGYFEGKVQNYNGLPEISDLTFKQEDVTIGQGEVPAPAEMTIADVLANFDNLISRRVRLTNVYAANDIQKKGEYTIFQGDATIPFYTNVDLKNGFKKGSIFDVTAIVTPYNDKKQVKIFEEAAIERLIPAMSMSDIQALCTSSNNASFAGVFEGLYVNYILGTQHIYLEDASGALRYYCASGNTLKVGDKVSGVITGTCRLDSGRPTINWLDFKYATVEAAPADEQPKPVTGTLASFTDVAGLMYRRVYLEDVVLEADLATDKSSQIITISDATGTFPLHLRFKPSQAVPKGSKVTFTGTFDVNGGKLEIRVFAEKEVTKVTPPSEPKLTVERVWGKYSTADASWNAYYGGIAGAERNVALDGQYVYIPETGTKKLWAISVTDPSRVQNVDVSTVTDEGTFKISCPRVIKNTDSSINGGKDVLVVSNMIEGDPTLYFYVNGVFSAPKVVKATTWASRRLGDTFTYAGTLQEGVFFFKDFNSAQGTVTFPMKFKSDLSQVYLTGRLVAPAVTGAGAYFPYPDNMANGVCSVRGGGNAQLVATSANFLTAEGAITPTLTDLSGYYKDAAFRFFEFEGKRYVAYTRQVSDTDGRLFIIEGEKSDSWDSIISTRKVVYHAAIQNSKENDAEPGESPKASGNSGMDLDVYEVDGAVLIAVVKQNVGLSLFKMSMK